MSACQQTSHFSSGSSTVTFKSWPSVSRLTLVWLLLIYTHLIMFSVICATVGLSFFIILPVACNIDMPVRIGNRPPVDKCRNGLSWSGWPKSCKFLWQRNNRIGQLGVYRCERCKWRQEEFNAANIVHSLYTTNHVDVGVCQHCMNHCLAYYR